MKGRALLRSAFKAVTEEADCWVGAKAEAEARRVAAATNFIMVIILNRFQQYKVLFRLGLKRLG